MLNNKIFEKKIQLFIKIASYHNKSTDYYSQLSNNALESLSYYAWDNDMGLMMNKNEFNMIKYNSK